MFSQPRIYKLGSSKENDIVISDSSVSPFHAEIFRDPDDNIFYTDLHSKNGSYVNGEKIIEPILLHPNDRLMLGKYYFDWEHLILGRTAIKAENDQQSVALPFVQQHLDVILIYGAILLMLIILSIITS